MNKIEEVWLIEESGICLYNQSLGTVDETLFSGFLSSLQTFIETIGEERLKKIEMGNSKITIAHLEEYKIILALRSPKKTKDKYLEKKIEEIQMKFITKYGSQLVKHQIKHQPYNTTIFEDFYIDLKEIFEEKIDKNITDWLQKI
ncbi:MAG: hypothetical protein ACTSRG_21075 [Candidatus Helarchaeota archaeon]